MKRPRGGGARGVSVKRPLGGGSRGGRRSDPLVNSVAMRNEILVYLAGSWNSTLGSESSSSVARAGGRRLPATSNDATHEGLARSRLRCTAHRAVPERPFAVWLEAIERFGLFSQASIHGHILNTEHQEAERARPVRA